MDFEAKAAKRPLNGTTLTTDTAGPRSESGLQEAASKRGCRRGGRGGSSTIPRGGWTALPRDNEQWLSGAAAAPFQTHRMRLKQMCQRVNESRPPECTIKHSNKYVKSWVLGWFMCKTMSYLQGVAVSASINTLVAISMDRCLAICYPLKCQLSTRSVRKILVIIWTFSIAITFPWALYFTLQPLHPSIPGISLCVEQWPDETSSTLYFILAHLVLCYLFPLLLIIVCYSCIWVKVWRRSIPGESKHTEIMVQKSKLKVVKMMFVVVVIFVISWLPLYIIFTRIKLDSPPEEGSVEWNLMLILTPVAQWLGASNSCINPVLYAYFNQKFRKGFLAIIKSRSCCGTLREPSYSVRGTTLRSGNTRGLSRSENLEYVEHPRAHSKAGTLLINGGPDAQATNVKAPLVA
ncbi:neuropeptide SIFamide receptor [Ixodes scapularis]